MNSIVWNPWHGCEKYSEGCLNCYVYRRDGSVGRDATRVEKNADFDLPLRRTRSGNWKLPDGTDVYCCMTSDFFLPAADEWRGALWHIFRERPGLRFTIITKRITRFPEVMPENWGNGYPNVRFFATVESQRQAEIRMPVFDRVPAAEKGIVCEPLLTKIDLSPWLSPAYSQLICGGESGIAARPCDYDWILSLREQCAAARVSFHFKQTGALFLKGGRAYRIPRPEQHRQARPAGIDLSFPAHRRASVKIAGTAEQMTISDTSF